MPVGTSEYYSAFGTGYVLFNITGDIGSWSRSTTADQWMRSTHGEWARFTSEDLSSQLDISICTTAFHLVDLNISASRNSSKPEPFIWWDPTKQKFNTSDIRRQLGATQEQLSIDDRGLFALEPPESNLTLNFMANNAQNWETSSASNNSLALCQYCDWDTEAYADAAQSAIFQDILKETSHPALALQAYGTLLYRMYYYSRAEEFDLQAPASVTNFVPRNQPTAHRGFIIYSVFIFLHFALLFFITYLFLSSKRQTLLGNSWQAIAQMISVETAPILDFADKATDSEVSEWIKKKGKNDSSFRIMGGEGGIRLRRCSD